MKTGRCARGAAAATTLLALASHARGQTRVDGIEHMFGASNTNAVGGHGRLTVGVSPDGDLTLLSWPSPSYYDQLAYMASNDLNVRDEPHLGALDGMGSYLGLLIDSGGGPTLSWLRDAPWTHAQTYSKQTSAVPVTTFTRDDLSLTVTLTDIVSPDADVLTRHMHVTKGAGSPVTSVSLVLYENLSPCLSKLEQLPFVDWALDSHNDFLALYDDQTGQIIHFHPGDRHKVKGLFDIKADPAATDYGAVEALMKEDPPVDGEVSELVQDLDGSYAPGVAAVVTTSPAPTEFQVGGDATPLCSQVDVLADNIEKLPALFPDVPPPLDPQIVSALRCTDPLPLIASGRGWTWTPEDALADAADGSLSGSRVAAGQTNGALIAPLAFSGDEADGSVAIALGATLADARSALGKVSTQTVAERKDAAEAATDAALKNAHLPDPALGDLVHVTALRALVNVYVARDAESGAIVASVSRQPPYHLDWPRDGAFFSAGLDAAGIHDWVTQRFEWYTGLFRAEPTTGNFLLTPNVPTDPRTGDVQFPADALEMNYFADGTIGGPIRFEIDNTALHVWSLALHAAHLQEPERKAFVDAIWPSAERALGLLTTWREAGTGLPAPANEDDNFALTSGLHAAVSVYAAVRAGARLAAYRGDEEGRDLYLKDAAVLKKAIFDVYWDDTAGMFRERRDAPPHAGSGTVAWAIWPARLLEPDDPRLEQQLDKDMDAILARLQGEEEGASYTPKSIQSAALYGKDGGSRDKAKQALDLLAAVATSDTHHFGETYVAVHDGSTLTWSNRVAPPHVWAGVLFYMAAMSLSEPASFTLDETELPLPKASSTNPTARGGCDCGIPHPREGVGVWLSLAALGLVMARRFRRGRSTPAAS